MAKIKLPPKKETPAAPVKAETNASEKKIQAVINKGGSVIQADDPPKEDTFKNFNIRILESELQAINQLREKRPKARGQKRSGISLHDWIIEAIQEKTEREKKKFSQV